MRTDNLVTEVASFLNICATGRKILGILPRSKRGLLVSEIVARSKRSERAIRAHLKLLLQLRLIRRKKVVTKRGKLAYRYLALQTHELIRSTKGEMRRRLRGLEAHVRSV
jgi:predicted DNA-binding transcriptional regulator